MTVWGDGGAYGVWASHLESWQTNLHAGDRSLPRLEQRDFTTDTWARLINRMYDALGVRLGLWSDALSQAISRSESEFAFGHALTQARTGLGSILALAEHPSLPDDLRDKLRGVVEQQIRSAQTQLEQQVTRMQQTGAPRGAVEARIRTVRDNPLVAVLAPGWADTQRPAVATPAVLQSDPATRTKRTFAL